MTLMRARPRHRFNPAHRVSCDTSRMKTASYLQFRQTETDQILGSYETGETKPS
jgi:hypothetical protein